MPLSNAGFPDTPLPTYLWGDGVLISYRVCARAPQYNPDYLPLPPNRGFQITAWDENLGFGPDFTVC